MTPQEKNKRYETLRLVKRARGGLYKAERQALIFIAEAQTMQDGVCRKALKRAEDLAYGERSVRWGLRGRYRNGKTEYPGVLARGIVKASGNLKGGRAPGGSGLPVTYVIDVDALMQFIPEVDDPDPTDDESPEKGEPNHEPKGEPNHEPNHEPSSKKGEPKGDLIPTRSFSSSYTPSAEDVTTSDQRESRLAQTTALIVDDDAAKPKTSGHKNTATAEARGEDILSAHRAKQLDRKTPVTEIKYRIQSIFDRVAHEASLPGSERCRDISLEKGSELKTNKEQWNELVDLYRTVGGETVAAKWEEYLVQDDHEVTELVDECEEDGKLTGRKITQTVQRTYLLRRFLEKYDYVLRQSMPVFIPSSVSDDGSVVEIELAGACGEKPKEQV